MRISVIIFLILQSFFTLWTRCFRAPRTCPIFLALPSVPRRAGRWRVMARADRDTLINVIAGWRRSAQRIGRAPGSEKRSPMSRQRWRRQGVGSWSRFDSGFKRAVWQSVTAPGCRLVPLCVLSRPAGQASDRVLNDIALHVPLHLFQVQLHRH